MPRLRESCLWWRDLPASEQQHPPDSIKSHYDVAVIGAGYTGLWTACFLKQLKPDWRIAIFEQNHAGYGASGRNGGWLIGGVAGQEDWLAALPESEQSQSRELLYGIVESVKAFCRKQQIDCDLNHAGVLYAAARYSEQSNIAHQWLDEIRASNQPESAFHWLSRTDTEQHLHMPGLMGGIYSPHCATLNPAKLVLGLVDMLRKTGVHIFEQTPVHSVAPRHLIVKDQQPVSCEHIVVASEAFPSAWSGLKRKRLPVFSNVIATRALSAPEWQQTVKTPGLAFSDVCRSVTYGQRSTDGHLVFGARGGYQFGGKARFEFGADDPAFKAPLTYLQRLFPSLSPDDIDYRWAGSLAVSRRFRPFAGYDQDSGIAYAGGYGGEGVGASHLFGRTLADLITGHQTSRTRQPWVVQGPASTLSNWEAEPLPWLGYQTIGKILALEDWLCHERRLPWLQKPVIQLSRTLSKLLH